MAKENLRRALFVSILGSPKFGGDLAFVAKFSYQAVEGQISCFGKIFNGSFFFFNFWLFFFLATEISLPVIVRHVNDRSACALFLKILIAIFADMNLQSANITPLIDMIAYTRHTMIKNGGMDLYDKEGWKQMLTQIDIRGSPFSAG